MIRRGFVVAGLAVLALLGACGKKNDAPEAKKDGWDSSAPAAPEFKVLATTDLRDIEPLAEMVAKATGVKLKFQFGGTMESTEAVLTGATQADAAWFAVRRARPVAREAAGKDHAVADRHRR